MLLYRQALFPSLRWAYLRNRGYIIRKDRRSMKMEGYVRGGSVWDDEFGKKVQIVIVIDMPGRGC